MKLICLALTSILFSSSVWAMHVFVNLPNRPEFTVNDHLNLLLNRIPVRSTGAGLTMTPKQLDLEVWINDFAVDPTLSRELNARLDDLLKQRLDVRAATLLSRSNVTWIRRGDTIMKLVVHGGGTHAPESLSSSTQIEIEDYRCQNAMTSDSLPGVSLQSVVEQLIKKTEIKKLLK